MIRRLDNDLVRADSVHLIEETFALFVEVTLNSKGRKLIWNYTDGPAGSVRASAVPPIHENLIGRFRLVSRAKRAVLGILGDYALAQKIHWTLSTVGGDDHPTASNRVSS